MTVKERAKRAMDVVDDCLPLDDVDREMLEKLFIYVLQEQDTETEQRIRKGLVDKRMLAWASDQFS